MASLDYRLEKIGCAGIMKGDGGGDGDSPRDSPIVGDSYIFLHSLRALKRGEIRSLRSQLSREKLQEIYKEVDEMIQELHDGSDSDVTSDSESDHDSESDSGSDSGSQGQESEEEEEDDDDDDVEEINEIKISEWPSYSHRQLYRVPYRKIQAFAKNLCVPCAGTKADIISRLQHFLSSKNEKGSASQSQKKKKKKKTYGYVSSFVRKDRMQYRAETPLSEGGLHLGDFASRKEAHERLKSYQNARSAHHHKKARESIRKMYRPAISDREFTDSDSEREQKCKGEYNDKEGGYATDSSSESN